jgi:hypothetical protein
MLYGFAILCFLGALWLESVVPQPPAHIALENLLIAVIAAVWSAWPITIMMLGLALPFRLKMLEHSSPERRANFYGTTLKHAFLARESEAT